MSIGNSGRIVIEIPSEKKRLLYGELGRRGLSLKEWFLDQVEEYLRENGELHLSGKQKLIGKYLGKSDELAIAQDVQGKKAMPIRKSNKGQNSLNKTYEMLESKYSVRVLSNDVSYVSPVNFVESMRHSRHRWFPYKEGFSPTFVQKFISEFTKASSGIVLDPFSGVGTTGLVASKMGFDAVGLDVSPMATFIAKAKSTQMQKTELSELSQFIKDIQFSSLVESSLRPENATVISYFEDEYLSALLSIRKVVDEAPSEKIFNLALLAFLTLIEEFSTHRKAGNGVKRKTRVNYQLGDGSPIEKVRQSFLNKLMEMRADLEVDRFSTIPDFRVSSCINSKALHEFDEFELALTSPPYANCFDYSKIYMRELWLGGFFKSQSDQIAFRNGSIRSHVHATWKDRNVGFGSAIAEELICPDLASQELWSKKIPSMISGYFKDIGALLTEVHPRLRKGASFGIVVGNSVYGGIPVATDLLIAEMAESMGYKVARIDVYRGVIPSSQQYARIDDKRWARESTVIVKKK